MSGVWCSERDGVDMNECFATQIDPTRNVYSSRFKHSLVRLNGNQYKGKRFCSVVRYYSTLKNKTAEDMNGIVGVICWCSRSTTWTLILYSI